MRYLLYHFLVILYLLLFLLPLLPCPLSSPLAGADAAGIPKRYKLTTLPAASLPYVVHMSYTTTTTSAAAAAADGGGACQMT